MFRKAERKQAKLRLGLVGPAGSGKTYGALLVAMGLGGRVAMIDTENGSGDLYAGLGDYDVCTLSAPYEVQKYLASIKEAEAAGYDVLIIDSLSHAWAGEGGLLDQQGRIADSGRGNSYTAWRQVTPWHNKLVEAMLTSPCHIIATMRAKTEYVQEQNERGKTEIRKVGLAPVQRDGMDYEFSVVFDLSASHTAQASKDRTSLFDGRVFQLGKDTGAALREWLEHGKEPEIGVEAKKEIWHAFLEAFGDEERAKNEMLIVTEGRGSKDWTGGDVEALRTHLEKVRDTKAKEATPEEKLKGLILDLTGPGGLYLTGGDLEAFLYETVKKTDLDAMSLAELRKVEKAARGRLEKMPRGGEQG